MFHSARTGPIENAISRFSRFHLGSTQVCSEHFVRATGWHLLPGESPSLVLLSFKESAKEKRRRQPRECPCVDKLSVDTSDDSEEQNARDVSTQMDVSSVLIEEELTAAAAEQVRPQQ